MSVTVEFGIFITLEEPTRDMVMEAATAGSYHSPGWKRDFPKSQLLTVEQLLNGAQVEMPPSQATFKAAPRVKVNNTVQPELRLE
jgi:site-specific DNA-methyltransferase (adenine-specific)